MAAPYTTVWTHGGASANDHAVAWVEATVPSGKHAISGGGYMHGDSTTTSTETNGDGASAAFPIVGMRAVYDSGPDRTNWLVGFACPPGTSGGYIRYHVFALYYP